MRAILFTVFLGLAARQDQKKRKIPVTMFLWFGLPGILVWFITAFSGTSLHAAVLGFLPGVFCLFLSYGTRGAIGAGDGCFFLAAALYLPWKQVWILLLGGFLWCSVGSLYILGKGLLQGRAVRGVRLPFLPFLLPVWLGILCSQVRS